MNDTHMSHAMEFAYPQSIANCVTCHEGKLDMILADGQFTLATCKSCHPVTGVDGTDPKRAPALMDLIAPVASIHPANLYTFTGDCNFCHKTDGVGSTFAEIHSGYSKAIYATEGVRYADTVESTVTSASFDAASNVLTVDFSVSGAAANAIVKPTVVVSLYGYDTKDFIVSGHGSAADGKRNLEWAEASSRNGPRLTVAPATATAGNTTWTATADLSTWATMLADGAVKRAEIGFLPYVGLDQTVAAGGANPYIAVGGVTKTFDLVGKALLADDDAKAYGRAIVDTGKCNACHDALATTFHSPAYGSAGVVGCRLCHVGLSGGSHLEMQSRSIDSYVHAIHSMQPFDIGDIDFTDPVAFTRYAHHIESTYPNFTLLNCESCHNPGTYEVPDNSRSLPGLLSAADAVADRSIGAVPAYVTGPASRACGSCHRARMINEDNMGELVSFNEHTGTFGYLLEGTTDVLNAAIAKIMAIFN
jgi:OmcA/MtrC family decaheme c-type cytochrome